MDKPETTEQHNSADEAGDTLETQAGAGPRSAKERLYDRIPLTYRQVDILTKVLIALLAAVLLVGILTGNRG